MKQADFITSSRSGIPDFESTMIEATDLQVTVADYLQLRDAAKTGYLLLLRVYKTYEQTGYPLLSRAYKTYEQVPAFQDTMPEKVTNSQMRLKKLEVYEIC